MARETRSVGEHVRTEVERREIYREKLRLEKAVRAVHRHLFRRKLADAARVLQEHVVDAMGLTPAHLEKYLDDLDEDEKAYNYLATHHFLTNAPDYVVQFEASRSPDLTTSRAAGLETTTETAEKRLRDAFLTIENIAIQKGLIRSELTNASALQGFSLDLGVVYKDFNRTLPGTVKLWGIDEDEDVVATAIQGAPGNGKSQAVETLAEDRYAAGHKVVDCLDWLEAENVFHDVRSQRENLLERRDELDLPRWWDDIDGVDEPQVEVLMPLTPELCNWRVPYNLEREEYTVRPFTIPTSEVSKRAIKAMLTHTTGVQDSVVERALKQVSEFDDWTLADLADAIVEVGDDDQVVDRLLTNLETLQKSSFLRDKQDEHCIDWDRIMSDTDTITCFSVAGMSDTAEKYMVMLYITQSLMEERETTTAFEEDSRYPRLTSLWRELRIICPPESKKTKDPRLRELEGALIDTWRNFSTLHRHNDVEIIADSQQFETQIHSDVRANFQKGLTFRNKKPHVRKFWKSFGADYENQYVRRVATQFSPGDFAFLGESSVDERTFHSPCYLAPSMSHHIDTKEEDHGFIARTDYLEHEELRSNPWTAELPKRFEISRGTDRVPSRDEPVAYFAYNCLDVVGAEEWESTDDVYQAYRSYAASEGCEQLNKQNFGTRLAQYFQRASDRHPDDYEKKEKMVDGDRFMAYFGLRLNQVGRRHLTETGPNPAAAD